jgi:hypothetical protein
MTDRAWRSTYLRLAYLLLVALALANGGCLIIAAGAAGGAAVGYCYYKGKVCATYNARLADTWAATESALHELGMPIVKQEQQGDKGWFESRTSNGQHVKIHLQAQESKIPAEGQLTQVCVRVGTFGDRQVSERVLDQVGLHLAPPAVPLPTSPPPTATLGPIQTGATALPQTPPPPTAAPPTAPPPSLPPEPRAVQQ